MAGFSGGETARFSDDEALKAAQYLLNDRSGSAHWSDGHDCYHDSDTALHSQPALADQ